MNLFEKASRKQYRFPSSKGEITVEDLWNMPLKRGAFSLDKVAITLNRSLKETSEESFVTPAESEDIETKDKFEIVKHVIAVRVQELADAKEALKRKEMKEKLASIIEDKRDESLRGKSLEELQAEYNQL